MNKSLNLILASIAAVTVSMSSIVFLSAFAMPSGSYNSTHFRITNMSMIDNTNGFGGYLAIVGFVRNIGNVTYDNVGFAVTLYDKNNTLIDVAEGFPTTSDAQIPGLIAPFKISVSTPPSKLDHYVIEVTASP